MKPTSCFLILLLGITFAQAQNNTARRGTLDLRKWKFYQQGYVELNGEWEFYMSELLTPQEVLASDKVKDFIDFPSVWNDLSKSKNPGLGFATYHLKVLIGGKQSMAIELPHFYSNYKVWVNGKEIASNGMVGTTAETSVAEWHPQTILFDAPSDTLSFVIQASNFHHAKGGVREPIRLGTGEELLHKRAVAFNSTIVLCGGLFLLALIFITIYFFKIEKSALYFAALCLTWAVREGFSNIYIIPATYPQFPWEVALRIEYITLYLTMVWAMLFLTKLFPLDSSNVFKYIFVAGNVIFLLFTLFAPTTLFTQFLPVYLSIAALLLLYIIYVLLHAVVNDRKGVWLMVSCMMVGVIVFSYDLIAYEGFASYNSLITHAGYLGMFLLMGLCLTIQFGYIRRTSRHGDMLTYEDLYGKGGRK